MPEQTPEQKFQESLAEKLIKVGEENISKAERSEAMRNLASAFTEPVKNFIVEESAAGSADITSSDGSVTITPKVTAENTVNDLSVKSYVDGRIPDISSLATKEELSAEAADRKSADDELRTKFDSALDVDFSGDTMVFTIKSL